MAADRKIVTYFVEDIAQETFVKAVVERMAREIGIIATADVRSATRGGRPLAELKAFLRDERRRSISTTDLLVIAIDGNCKGYSAKRKEIVGIIDQIGYIKRYVCAIPDPHVERWYLCDGEAVRTALSASVQPTVPLMKCERDLYKKLLRKVIEEAEIAVILGGSEHGEAIVRAMDLYRTGKNEPSLGSFLDDLHSALYALANS